MNSWNLGEGPRGGRCTESVRIGPNLETHDFAANSLKPVVTDMNFMKLFSVLHLVQIRPLTVSVAKTDMEIEQ